MMAKLYKSLLFRELKISRHHYVVRSLLMISFAAMLLLAVFVIWKEDIANATPRELMEFHSIIAMFGLLFAMLTAVLAAYDTDIFKSDVNTGWLRYSYALPITAKDKTLVRYSVKGAVILIGGILCAVFAVLLKNSFGQHLLAGTINTYFVILDAMLLADLFRSLLMISGRTEKQVKLLGLIFNTVLLGGFIFLVVISGMDKFIEELKNMSGNDTLPIMEFTTRLLHTAEKLSFIPFLILIALFLSGFFTTVKVFERREP